MMSRTNLFDPFQRSASEAAVASHSREPTMQVHNLQTTRRDQRQRDPDPVVVLGRTPTEPLLALEAEWRGLLAEQAATHKQKCSICDTQRLEAESRINDANDRTNEVGDKLTEIEDQILEAPPATLDGVRPASPAGPSSSASHPALPRSVRSALRYGRRWQNAPENLRGGGGGPLPESGRPRYNRAPGANKNFSFREFRVGHGAQGRPRSLAAGIAFDSAR